MLILNCTVDLKQPLTIYDFKNPFKTSQSQATFHRQELHRMGGILHIYLFYQFLVHFPLIRKTLLYNTLFITFTNLFSITLKAY